MDNAVLARLNQDLSEYTPEQKAQLLRELETWLGVKPRVDAALLDAALQAIDETIRSGIPPRTLPAEVAGHARLQSILANLAAIQRFVLAIAQGNLNEPLSLKGRLGGGCKALQANLRHLTWQTQQIAQGDFSQRVDFMGEFSEAFNSMVVALADARSQLEAQNAELDAFAHTVAHDLKNPLSAIIGYLELLTEYDGTMAESEKKETLAYVTKAADKAVSIIDNLLLLSSTHKQVVELCPLDMGAIVNETQERLRYMLEQYHAEISVPPHWPRALGYGPWIEEVWTNYISNALKYGGTPPRVELGFTILDSGSPIPDPLAGQEQSKIENPKSPIKFWVRDNGQGMTPEEQARLFALFERLSQTRIKGHGLGLSIVRRIVEKLGGQVGVESEVGRGSVFYFTLPAYQEKHNG